ncbi:MAG: hypothetical protein AB9907_01980 [Flexilinea sp.]
MIEAGILDGDIVFNSYIYHSVSQKNIITTQRKI